MLSSALLAILSVTADIGSESLALTVDQQRFAARLLSIDSSWRVGLEESRGARRDTPLTKLVAWGRPHEPTRGDLTFLADGSLLVGAVVGIDRRYITVDNDVWGESPLPRRLVRGIVWQPPGPDMQRWRLIDRVRAGAADEDELLLSNGDRVYGRLARLERQTVQFATATGELELKLDQVVAWIQQSTDERTEIPLGQRGEDSPRNLVGLSDGSLLVAQAAQLGLRLIVELASGVELISAPLVRPIDEGTVVYLQPLGGRVKYVSDLQPLGYKDVPFLTLTRRWRADRNVLGGPLRADDVTYPKGLGMHSTSRLAYKLDRAYERFDAEIAIDQVAGQGGSVVFRVFTNAGGRDWNEAYKSPVVRGGEPPRPISVDISGSRRIALVVGFEDRGDQLDYADWLNARLIAAAE